MRPLPFRWLYLCDCIISYQFVSYQCVYCCRCLLLLLLLYYNYNSHNSHNSHISPGAFEGDVSFWYQSMSATWTKVKSSEESGDLVFSTSGYTWTACGRYGIRTSGIINSSWVLIGSYWEWILGRFWAAWSTGQRSYCEESWTTSSEGFRAENDSMSIRQSGITARFQECEDVSESVHLREPETHKRTHLAHLLGMNSIWALLNQFDIVQNSGLFHSG